MNRKNRQSLPLNALRVFDAAARQLSFKKAAQELGVTPAAVSQQIRALEESLGAPLFQRTGRSIRLTDDASDCLRDLDEGFQLLEKAFMRLRQPQMAQALRVSVSPSFASKWLVPRLGRFQDSHPEATVRVSSTMELVDFDDGSFDLAIRYGAGNYPGLHVRELMRETVTPVCSPELLDGREGLERLEDLGQFTLIHDDSSLEDPSCPDWVMWLKAAGVRLESGHRAWHFDQPDLAIQAAVAGRGVALAKAKMAESDLLEGRLVQPFRVSQPVDFAYYVVCPEGYVERPAVASFIQWLQSEAEG